MERSQVSGCVITKPAFWLPAVWNTICMFRISSLSVSSLCCSPRWVITIKETLLWRRRLPDSRSLPAISGPDFLPALLSFIVSLSYCFISDVCESFRRQRLAPVDCGKVWKVRETGRKGAGIREEDSSLISFRLCKIPDLWPFSLFLPLTCKDRNCPSSSVFVK